MHELTHPSSTSGLWMLDDSSFILIEQEASGLLLTHLEDGNYLRLDGLLANRMSDFLAGKDSTPFPPPGLPAAVRPWLEQLRQALPMPNAHRLLMGNGLGMLFIELTDRCNERCIHCYAESSPDCNARLSREEIRRVLEEARALGNPVVQFTGGDPLLHPHLVFAVQTAHALEYPVIEIYTNGLALKPALMDALKPFTPCFALSVYAADAATHDRITRTPGSLRHTLEAIRRILDAGLELRIGIISITGEAAGGEVGNQGMVDETIHFLQQEFGLDDHQIGVDSVRATGRGVALQPGIHARRPSVKRRIRRGDRTPDARRFRRAGNRATGARRGKLCISADGDVFPCIFSRRTPLGNIRTQSIAGILRALEQRRPAAFSQQRWQACRQRLSCSDCQAIACLLGDGDAATTKYPGESHAAT